MQGRTHTSVPKIGHFGPFWPFLGGSSGVVKHFGVDFFDAPDRYPEVDGGSWFRISSMCASLGGTGFLVNLGFFHFFHTFHILIVE